MCEKRLALIPAFQPDEMLLDVIRDCRAQGLSPVVVDDGSGPEFDRIFTWAKDDAVVLRYEENRGKGQALKTGLSWIREHVPAPYAVVTVDADGQHPAQDAARLIRRAEREPDAMILGSRRMTGRAPLRSRIGNAAMRLIYRLASGQAVYDTQTGLRAFTDRLAPWLLSVPGDRYEYEMSALLRAPHEGVRLIEEEIPTVYLDGNRSSHFDTLRDSARICRVIREERRRQRREDAAAGYGPAQDCAADDGPDAARAEENSGRPEETAAARQFGKFSLASFAGFLTDLGVYTALTAVLGTASAALLAANVLARCVSGTVNFLLNRHLVFRSRKPVLQSAARYALLALAVLAANSGLLLLLTQVCGLAAVPAKILTELSCFVASFLCQRLVVFAPEKGKDSETEVIQVKKETKRRGRGRWVPVYLALLLAFTVYTVMDTFVIERVYTPVTATAGTSSATVSGEASGSGTSSEMKAETEAEAGAASEAETGAETERSLVADSSGRTHRHGSRSRSDSTGSASDSTAGSSGTAESSGSQGTQAAVTATSYQDENLQITLTTLRRYDTTVYAAEVAGDPSFLKTAFAKGAYGRNVTAKTSETAAQVSAILAVNGDYYGAQEKGYVIRGGVLYRDTAVSGREDLVIWADGSMEIVCEDDVTAQELLAAGAREVLSFGPGLVEDGQISVTEGEEVGKAMASNPRTAIGVLENGNYILVVSDGRTEESEGLSLYELAQVMQELGAVTAYNLDGGGSSAMVFNGQLVNKPTTSGSSIKERSVSDIVYIGY